MNANKPATPAAAPAAPAATNNSLNTTPNQNSTTSGLNSIAANNTTPINASNNFDKALNTELKKEYGNNNSDKLVKSLNTRVKTSEQALSANNTNKPSSEPAEGGIFNKLTTFAKNTASNILPTRNKSKVTELGDIDIGSDVSIIADTDNYIIILGVFIVIVLVIVIYFFSKTFNVSRTLDKMKMYHRYQNITSIDMSQQLADEPLYKFQIASAYNTCHSGNQMFSYTSELIAKSALRSGARYLELNIFSSVYGPKGIPVVDSGYAQGEWKLMLNTTTFESVIRLISENAFRVASEDDGTPNNTDPLFIGLNLSTGGNTFCLDLMANILTDYFRDKLLDAKYAFQFATDFAKTPLRELENKVIIFSSPGFEGSRLEELVNAVWYDENFNASGIVAGTIEGFQTATSNTDKVQKTDKQRKSVPTALPKDAALSFNSPAKKPNKSDQLSALMKSLADDTPASNAAKKSNKNSHAGGPSDKQILSEKASLTQNIRALADELKDSGLEIHDVDELVTDVDNTGPPNESLADIPSPTELGLDQILNSQTPLDSAGSRATIMRVCAQKFDDAGFDSGRIKTHIANGGLCIVVPHREGDFITRNYDPQRAFELGCQFIAMNFQEIDENMDKYITRFESKAILPVG